MNKIKYFRDLDVDFMPRGAGEDVRFTAFHV